MGFGILFFALFLTCFGAFTPISTYTYLLGSAVLLYALYRLAGQNKLFLCSAIGAAILLVDSAILVVLSVFGLVSNVFYLVVFNIQVFLFPILLLIILSAIFVLAKEVELRKIQGWCIVNSIFVLIYLVCDTVSIFVRNESAFARLGMVCLVSQILYSFFMLVIAFNCYARICYEDDKNMEKSNTGMPVFDFLNKLFNKATDKNRKNGTDDKGDK